MENIPQTSSVSVRRSAPLLFCFDASSRSKRRACPSADVLHRLNCVILSHPVEPLNLSLCKKKGLRCTYSEKLPNRHRSAADQDHGDSLFLRKEYLDRYVARHTKCDYIACAILAPPEVRSPLDVQWRFIILLTLYCSELAWTSLAVCSLCAPSVLEYLQKSIFALWSSRYTQEGVYVRHISAGLLRNRDTDCADPDCYQSFNAMD